MAYLPVHVVVSQQAAESKLAMMEANEEQLRQRQERRAAEKEEENRLIQIMLNKFKVRGICAWLWSFTESRVGSACRT